MHQFGDSEIARSFMTTLGKNITRAALLLLLTLPNAPAQIVSYTFGSTANPVITAHTVAANLSASVFSGTANSSGTGGSTPISSGAYFGGSNWVGEGVGVNYFEFTITPAEGFEFSTTALSIDYRVTSTGPTTLSIRSSNDGFATSLATLSTVADSLWHVSEELLVTLSHITEATTFRIYGYGASSVVGTLRVDNVLLAGTVSAVPEPATNALFFATGALGLVLVARLRKNRMPPRTTAA